MKNMPDTFIIYFASCLRISKQWFYTVSGPFLQIKSANMHRWNIFLIEALSMLASPQIKTVKPPDKKPGISDKSSFFRRRSFQFQFVWQKLCYNIPLAGLLKKPVGLPDSSSEYEKSFVCWREMCPMVVLWMRMFYRNYALSTTCQGRQLILNPLSPQINIYCLVTNQTPKLLVQRASWTRATVMLLKSLYFSRPRPPTAIIPDARAPPRYIWKSRWPPLTVRRAISRRLHEKIGDFEQSTFRASLIS